MKKSDKAKLILTALAAFNGLAPQIKLIAEQIAKAWESPEYRSTLTAEQLKSLPENPAGDLIFKAGKKGETTLIARSYSDDCRTYSDTCRSYSDDCRTYSDTCRSYSDDCRTYSDNCRTYSDTCSTQFDGCQGLV